MIHFQWDVPFGERNFRKCFGKSDSRKVAYLMNCEARNGNRSGNLPRKGVNSSNRFSSFLVWNKMINIEKSNKSLPKSIDKKSDFISARMIFQFFLLIFQLINPLRTSDGYFGKGDTSKMSHFDKLVISKSITAKNESLRQTNRSEIDHFENYPLHSFLKRLIFRRDSISKWAISYRSKFSKWPVFEVIDFSFKMHHFESDRFRSNKNPELTRFSKVPAIVLELVFKMMILSKINPKSKNCSYIYQARRRHNMWWRPRRLKKLEHSSLYKYKGQIVP